MHPGVGESGMHWVESGGYDKYPMAVLVQLDYFSNLQIAFRVGFGLLKAHGYCAA